MKNYPLYESLFSCLSNDIRLTKIRFEIEAENLYFMKNMAKLFKILEV